MVARSNRRLSLEKRRKAVDVYPLEELEASYINNHEQRNSSPKTIARYQQSFADFRRFLTESSLKPTSAVLTNDVMTKYSTWLKNTPIRGWRGSTVRSVHGTHGRLRDMKAFARWLEEEDYIDKAPKVVLPKLPQGLFPILTEAEITTLMQCRHLSGGSEQAVRNMAIFALMVETGLRLSEVASIKLADLDLDNATIQVWGKGHKQRRVFFTPVVETRLRDWLKIRFEDDDSLFQLTSRGIQQVFVRIRKETGIEIHPHKLRHQAATYMVRAHANTHTVQRILGHSSVTVTEKYLSLADEDLQAQHAAASPFERVTSLVETPQARKRRRLKSA